MTNPFTLINNTIVTNDFIVANLQEILLIEVVNNTALLFGKSRTKLLHIHDFNESLFANHNFMKVDSFLYINPVHIVSLNLKDKTAQLTTDINVKYRLEYEQLLINYLQNNSLL